MDSPTKLWQSLATEAKQAGELAYYATRASKHFVHFDWPDVAGSVGARVWLSTEDSAKDRVEFIAGWEKARTEEIANDGTDSI